MEKENLKNDMEMFRDYSESFYALPEKDFEQPANLLHYKKYNKGKVVLQEDKVCRHFWFIIKRCFRGFAFENGIDVSVRFFFEKSIANNLYDEIEHGNSFKLMSPEERYKSLLLTRPKYFQHIPLTCLASYLGIRSNITT